MNMNLYFSDYLKEHCAVFKRVPFCLEDWGLS